MTLAEVREHWPTITTAGTWLKHFPQLDHNEREAINQMGEWLREPGRLLVVVLAAAGPPKKTRKRKKGNAYEQQS